MRKPGRKLPGSSIADRLSLPSERILAALAARTPAGTAFGDQRHVLLVTYRRDGRPVATPVKPTADVAPKPKAKPVQIAQAPPPPPVAPAPPPPPDQVVMIRGTVRTVEVLPTKAKNQ